MILSNSKVKKFKIKVIESKSWMGVGVACEDFVKQKKTSHDVYTTTGTLFWSSNGYYWENNTSQAHQPINNGDTVEVTIKGIKINMKNLTTKSNVLDKTMSVKTKYYPAILFYYGGSIVEII